MKKQKNKTTRKVKVVKAKSKTLTQRIEALKALKVRRQKLTKRIEQTESKLLKEVEILERSIEEEPEVELCLTDTWEFSEHCQCIRCIGARIMRQKDGISFHRWI